MKVILLETSELDFLHWSQQVLNKTNLKDEETQMRAVKDNNNSYTSTRNFKYFLVLAYVPQEMKQLKKTKKVFIYHNLQ